MTEEKLTIAEYLNESKKPDAERRLYDEGGTKGPQKPWKPVVYANDCTPCEMCEEPVCPICEIHYAECGCPGPMQEDEYEYKTINEHEFARLKTPTTLSGA